VYVQVGALSVDALSADRGGVATTASPRRCYGEASLPSRWRRWLAPADPPANGRSRSRTGL